MPTFSPRTVIATVEAFRFATNAQIENLALEYGLLDVLGDGGIAKKESRLARHLVENPQIRGYTESSLVFELIERVVAERCRTSSGEPRDAAEVVPELVNALKQDGFVITDGHVRPMLPEAVPVASAQDELHRMLEAHGFTRALGHLDQATAAHARGDWAAANSQLRTFVEELLDRIAGRLSGGETDQLSSSHRRREWLARCEPPFLDPQLNEWDVGGTVGFVQGFWRRLHPEGSHPGLSDENDCTFRLHIVLIIAEHFMRRFDERVR